MPPIPIYNKLANNVASKVADAIEPLVTSTEDARDLTLSYLNSTAAARDTVLAAAGGSPIRASPNSTIMFNPAGGSYIDLPNYSNQPGTPALDWYIITTAVSSAMAGDGTIEYLLYGANGQRNISLPLIGSGSNKRILTSSLTIGGTTQFVRNATTRAGTAPLLLPPLESFAVVIASINGIPHFAAIRSDGTSFVQKGDTNFTSTSSWFFSGGPSSLTINRVSNELIITSGSASFSSATYDVGMSILIPNVGARVITTKVSGTQIKCYDPGPDASAIATSITATGGSYISMLRPFERAGGTTAGASWWTGGISKLISRWGVGPLPGEFSSELIDTDGYIKYSFLKSIIDGTYKTLPGNNRSTLDFGASTIGTGLAYTGGSPASQPTITGTVFKTIPTDQPSWLRLKPGQNPHNRVHAQEFGQSFGTVKYVFQSDAIPYGAVATIYDRHPNDPSAAVVAVTKPLFSPYDQRDPTAISCMVHKVPANSDYWMRVSLATSVVEVSGNSNYYVDVPCPVGFGWGDWQQSLTGVAMTIFSGYASSALSSGLATLASSWEGGSINAGTAPGGTSNQGLLKTYAYATNLRVSASSKWPDQHKYAANVMLDWFSTNYGRTGSYMFIPLVRSGHSKADALTDGKTFEVVVGTTIPDTPLSFASIAPFSIFNNKWTEPYTVELKIGEVVISRDDAASRSGSTAPWTNGVTGSWNYDNWNSSTITLPYAATVKVKARCRQTSSPGNNAVRENYGSAYVGDDFSYWGLDNVERSGTISANISQTNGITAVLDSWSYSILGSIGNSVSDTAAKELMYNQFIGIKNRCLQYPQFTNPRTGKTVPWFLPPEQRITSLETNHHRSRWLVQRIVQEHPDEFMFLPGCLTCQIDSAVGAHTDALGSIQVFVQKVLALRDAHAAAEGRAHRHHHIPIRVLSGIRLSSNSIKLFITPNPFGIGQHVASETVFSGLSYAATETHWAPAYVNTDSYTYSIDPSVSQPSITLTSPSSMPSGYYDLRGVPSAAGSKAVQDTALGRTLCVLNGEYPAVVNRRGSDVHPSDTIAGVYIA